MKSEKTVMLGCWGLGRSLYYRDEKNIIKVPTGPFKGNIFPSAFTKIANSISSWHLPPLSRSSVDGIDFMPFILYDKIVIDKIAFECLLGKRPSILIGKHNFNSSNILERLAEDGYIIEKDYEEELNRPKLLSLLDKMMIYDLTDPNIVIPCKESLKLWIKFHKEFFHHTKRELKTFYDILHTLDNMNVINNKSEQAFKLLYECIADINRILILSHTLNYPIYEWEDYLQYYKYKFTRVGETQKRTDAETLNQLFNLFIPNFSISDYHQLLDIKNDDRLDSVRDLMTQLKEKDLSNDIVVKAQEDVLNYNKKLSSYSKYIGICGYALNILPGIISNTIQLIANEVIEKILKRKIKWQTFFIDRKEEYNRKDIERRLKNISK